MFNIHIYIYLIQSSSHWQSMQERSNYFKNQSSHKNLLLTTNQIKKLDKDDFIELQEIIINLESDKILLEHLQDLNKRKLINKEALQAEIQSKDVRYNLPTIANEIYKEALKNKKTSFDYIVKVVQSGQQKDFINNTIKINIGEQTKKGKVNNAKIIDHSQVRLQAEYTDSTKHIINIHLGHKYINQIQIAQKNTQPLMKWLNNSNIIGRKTTFQNTQVIISNQFPKMKQINLLTVMYKFQATHNYKNFDKIIFNNLLDSKTEFNIQQIEGRRIVSIRGQKQKMRYDDFCKWINIQTKKNKIFQFNKSEEAQKFFKIQKLNKQTQSSVDTIKNINLTRKQLIKKLQSNDTIKLYYNLLQKMLSSKDLNQQQNFVTEALADYDEVKQKFADLINLNKRIGIIKTRAQYLKELLIQANYFSMIKKEGAIETVRIINLLTEAKENLAQLKNKDIIAFFGNTGSGKSTSVNYLMGIPLRKYQNVMGQNVIYVNEQKLELLKKRMQKIDPASIGQSLGTSETIYAKGHNFIKETLTSQTYQLVQNVVLCDNPGFKDTRGTQYEVCTGMSIDMAIAYCNQIKAIVLVIPFSCIILDRANHLVGLIQQMKEKFPSILNKNSGVYECFHILITKIENQSQINGLKSRLEKLVQEQEQRIQVVVKEKNKVALEHHQNRLTVFSTLLQMYEKERIKIINISNNIQKQEIVKFYMENNKCVPKQGYKCVMQNGEMKDSFMNQLSLATHTWVHLILGPFLSLYQQQINNFEQTIKDSNQSVNRSNQRVNELKIDMQKNKDKIKSLKINIQQQNKKKDKNQKNETLSNLFDENFQNQQNQIRSYKNKILDITHKLKQLQNQVQQKKHKKQKLTIEQQKTQKESKDMQNQINGLKTGTTDKLIFQIKYKYGEQIEYSRGNTQQQKQQAIRNVQKVKWNQIQGSIVAGKDQKILYYLPLISDSYALVPSGKQFDPSQYIKSHKFINSQYQAQIISKNAVLKQINNKPDCKKIIIHFELNFKPCDDETELPFLKIVHKIPNSQVNKAKIQNINAEIIQIQTKIRNTKNEIDQIKKDIKNFNEQINSLQSEVKSVKIAVDLGQKQIEKQKKDYLNQKINLITKDIKRQQQDIQKMNKLKEEYEKIEFDNFEKRQKYKFNYRRMAFLIRDQIQNRVPQSLYDFIQIAMNLSKDISGNEDEVFKLRNEDHQKNFTNFMKLYELKKSQLLKRIDIVLKDQKYRPDKKQYKKLNNNKVGSENQYTKVLIENEPIQANNQKINQFMSKNEKQIQKIKKQKIYKKRIQRQQKQKIKKNKKQKECCCNLI